MLNQKYVLSTCESTKRIKNYHRNEHNAEGNLQYKLFIKVQITPSTHYGNFVDVKI